MYFKTLKPWPAWLSWVAFCKAKGHWLDSRSGHVPGLLATSWLGVSERQLIDVSLIYQCFSPFLSPSLPLSLKINKILKKRQYLWSIIKWSTNKMRYDCNLKVNNYNLAVSRYKINNISIIFVYPCKKTNLNL